MPVSKRIKSDSKYKLQNNWAKAIVIFMLIVSVFIFISIIEELARMLTDQPMFLNGAFNINSSSASILITLSSLVLNLLFVAPLTAGNASWYWNNSLDGAAPSFAECFAFFKGFFLYFRTIRTQLLLVFIRAAAAITLFAPGIFLISFHNRMLEYEGFQTRSDQEYLRALPFFILGIILCLGALLLYSIITQRFSFALYILSDNKKISAMRAISLSWNITKGYSVKLFKFKFGFWYLWLLTPLIVPVLYVYPYYAQSTACFSRYILACIINSREPEEPEQDSDSETSMPTAEA